jgi:adenosylhomocysteine nucleosidase
MTFYPKWFKVMKKGGFVRLSSAPGKSLSTLFIVLVLMFLLGLRCTFSPQHSAPYTCESTSYLVVMSAYAPELTRHLENIELEDSCTLDGDTYYVGSLAGNEVILMLSGIGLENAAGTTRRLLDRYIVTGIVFSGIAGGINPELKIGDVTVPSRWGWADGTLGPDDEGFWIPVDRGMLETASAVGRGVRLSRCRPDSVCLDRAPMVVTGGNGISNSFFVDDAVYRAWLWDTFQANAVDMETAAVARIAHENAVPFIAFRSLSDLAGGGPGMNEIDIFFQLAADNAAAVVMAFLGTWAENRAE